ncbi:MAG: hypothetical protein WAT23_10795 [Chromatiaceae bacterium]
MRPRGIPHGLAAVLLSLQDVPDLALLLGTQPQHLGHALDSEIGSGRSSSTAGTSATSAHAGRAWHHAAGSRPLSGTKAANGLRHSRSRDRHQDDGAGKI